MCLLEYCEGVFYGPTSKCSSWNQCYSHSCNVMNSICLKACHIVPGFSQLIERKMRKMSLSVNPSPQTALHPFQAAGPRRLCSGLAASVFHLGLFCSTQANCLNKLLHQYTFLNGDLKKIYKMSHSFHFQMHTSVDLSIFTMLWNRSSGPHRPTNLILSTHWTATPLCLLVFLQLAYFT